MKRLFDGKISTRTARDTRRQHGRSRVRREEQGHTVQQNSHAFSQDKAIGANKGRRLSKWVYMEVLFRHSIHMMGSLDDLYVQSDISAYCEDCDRARCILRVGE